MTLKFLVNILITSIIKVKSSKNENQIFNYSNVLLGLNNFNIHSHLHIGLSCSDFDAVPMSMYNTNYTNSNYFVNPKICCPKSCGNKCNECFMNALQPSTCSITNGNMCYQDNEGKQNCCAYNVKKLCLGKTKPPCRLSK